ncbi:MAG: ATP-binding protein [Ghiorsea sp.]
MNKLSSLHHSLFRTFRGRLAMLYIGVEFIIILIGAVLIYVFLSNQIYKDVDEELFNDARDLVTQLEQSSSQQWNDELHDFATYYRGVVQLVDRKHQILFNVGENISTHDKKDVSIAIHDAFRFQGDATVFISTRGLLRKENLRVAVTPVQIQGVVVAVIVLARTTQDIQHFFKLLYIIGGILGLLSMLISAIVGYRMAKRALQPINAMTDAAQAVANGDLSRRLDSSVHDEEIGELVHSLNKMFACLETNFNSQKRFVSDTSHELRHPITILKGEIEVALMKERSPNEYQAILNQLFTISERMQHIVNDMLTLAQADAGTLEIPQEKVDLSLLLQEVGQHHMMLFSQRNIQLELNIQESLEILGDQHRIERVLYNLLNNAFRYAPKKSSVTLSAIATQHDVIIKVSDQGQGIQDSDQPFLFERFYRADDARNSQSGEGAGLGLAICKHIIHAHHGEIAVHSTLGQGATFEISLPLAAANPEFSQRLQSIMQHKDASTPQNPNS